MPMSEVFMSVDEGEVSVEGEITECRDILTNISKLESSVL